jgi:uncharacterized protein YycO
MLLSAAAPHGVAFSKLEDRLALASASAVIEVPVPDEAAALAWATSQVGRPYDWAGVVGIGLHRNWEDDDSWFCSEFAATAMKRGGYEPFRAGSLYRVVPEHIWMLNLPIIRQSDEGRTAVTA